MRVRKVWEGVRETLEKFIQDRPFQLAAAIAYYTLLSLAPLLLVSVTVASWVWGGQETRVQRELIEQIRLLVGEDGAQLIRDVLSNASAPGGGGGFSLAVGTLVLLIGASTVFFQLQIALDRVWDVRPDPDASTVMSFLRHRLLSLAMVLVIGFLMIVSLIASAAISAVSASLEGFLPGGAEPWQALDVVTTFALLAVFFALLFKVMPDAEVAWRDVWVGAAATSVLFTAGKFLIGLYLGHASIGSSYGAAGSVVVLMVWVYYSSLILFLGAEITQVYARRRGARVEPMAHAERKSGQAAAS